MAPPPLGVQGQLSALGDALPRTNPPLFSRPGVGVLGIDRREAAAARLSSTIARRVNPIVSEAKP